MCFPEQSRIVGSYVISKNVCKNVKSGFHIKDDYDDNVNLNTYTANHRNCRLTELQALF